MGCEVVSVAAVRFTCIAAACKVQEIGLVQASTESDSPVRAGVMT